MIEDLKVQIEEKITDNEETIKNFEQHVRTVKTFISQLEKAKELGSGISPKIIELEEIIESSKSDLEGLQITLQYHRNENKKLKRVVKTL